MEFTIIILSLLFVCVREILFKGDDTMIAKKTIGIIMYSILVCVFVLFFINATASLSSIQVRMTNSERSMITSILIIEMITSIICFILSIVGIVKVSHNPLRNQSHNVLLVMLFIFTTALHICGGIYYINYSNTSSGGTFLTYTILYLIASLLFFATSCVSYKGAYVAKSVLYFSTLTLFLITAINGLSSSQPTGATVSMYVFLFIALALSIPFFIINPKEQATKEIVSREKQLSSTGAAEKLEKLKDLYDRGILSKEEYEEKRKQYIDYL